MAEITSALESEEGAFLVSAPTGETLQISLELRKPCARCTATHILFLIARVGLPSVPQNVGPKPTLRSGWWAEINPQNSGTRQNLEGALREQLGFLCVPSTYFLII